MAWFCQEPESEAGEKMLPHETQLPSCQFTESQRRVSVCHEKPAWAFRERRKGLRTGLTFSF